MSVDARVIGFDIDWPAYESTRSAESGADISTVEARARNNCHSVSSSSKRPGKL